MKIKDIIPHLDLQEGDVGIEIEMESLSNTAFPMHIKQGLPKSWKAVHDGSLRGNCIEYVLRSPIKIGSVNKSVDSIYKLLADNNIVVQDSIRAGIHVHVNVQQLTQDELFLYAALYYAMEEILVGWCGSNRAGNLFCLRNLDAPGAMPYIGACFQAGRLDRLSSDTIRYASLNMNAVPKYGSVEFRSLKTDPTPDKLKLWAKVLYDLREKSKNYNSVMDFVEEFSMAGPREWCREVLGDFYEQIENQENLEEKVWRGIRNAQEFLFHAT